MAKVTKKSIRSFVESNDETIDYEKLRLDVLKGLVDSRCIECKNTKEEMIRNLKLDDQEKYIHPITYDKRPDGTFMVGIDPRDTKNCFEMGKFVEKGIAQRMNLYCNHRIHYISNQKLI